jgi:hypothetical protein
MNLAPYYSNRDEAEDAVYEQIAREGRRLKVKWSDWGTMERADAVVSLRRLGVSLRRLGRTARCSEGLIRFYEILGHVTPYWRDQLYAGRISASRAVALERERRRREAGGVYVEVDEEEDQDADDDE